MKNIIRSKFLIKLVASLCIMLTLLNIVPNNRVFAADSDDDEVFGSVLITPITKLLTGLGDGIMDLLHSNILGQGETIIKLDGDADTWWNQHGASVIGIILGLIVGVTFAVITFGAGSAVIAGMAGGLAPWLSGAAFIVKTAVTSLAVYGATRFGVTGVARFIDSAYLSNDIYVPVFNLTPEEIFSNRIWAFDVNFFNPNEYTKDVRIQNNVESSISAETAKAICENVKGIVGEVSIQQGAKKEYIEEITSENIENLDIIIKEFNNEIKKHGLTEITENSGYEINISKKYLNGKTVGQAFEASYKNMITISKSESQSKESYIINIESKEQTGASVQNRETYTTITSAKVLTMSILNEQTGVKVDSTAAQLKSVVSEWYYTLRNLAILITLLLLVYSGIRIVIGSTAGEKAKYKERIIDWVVSICLIFIMHYIMVFAVEINQRFVGLVDSTNGLKGIIKIIQLNTQNHLNVVKEHELLQQYLITDTDEGPPYGEEELSGMSFLQWPTNIAGGIRIEQQLINEGTANWIGYSLCYLVIVAYTVFFIWTYLRRVLYMAFLTMIAPLVAMTYSLDKITDGKAQAFNSWIKEYIFNLLIQPFHLILYTVLVSSAYELAGKNALYALVAIGFMMPAEKLLRKFFGFEKAQTPGALGGAAGAALAMTGLQKLIAFGNKDANPPQEDSKESNDIKFSSADGVSAKSVVEEALGGLKSGSSGTSSGGESDPDDGSGNSGAGSSANIRMRAEGSGPPGGREVDIEAPGESGTHINLGTGEERQDTVNIVERLNGPKNVDVPGNVTTNEPIVNRTTATGDNSSSPEGGTTISGGGTRKTGTTHNIDKDDLNLEKPKNPGIARRTGRALRTGISGYLRLQGQKNYKRIKKSRPIRSLLRGAAGLATGTFLGMAGLALGIASGDPSKAFQYTSAAAIGGWGIGKGVAGRVANAFSVDKGKMKDEWQLSYYGENYKKAKLKEQKREFARNEDNISYLRKTLGVSRKEAINILETTGAECLDSGVDKVEDVATIHKFREEQAMRNLINAENATLEEMVQAYENDNWNEERFDLTDGEMADIDEQMKKTFEEEEKALEEEEKAEKKRIDEEAKAEQERQKEEEEEMLRKLQREAEDKIEREDEQLKQLRINSETQDAIKDKLTRLAQLNADMVTSAGNSEEQAKIQNKIAEINKEIRETRENVAKRIEKEQKELLDEKMKAEKERRINEYIYGKDGKSGRKAKMEEQLREKRLKREANIVKKADEEKKKLDQKRKELDEKIQKAKEDQEVRVKMQKARQEYINSSEYNKARTEAIKKVKEAVEERNELYQQASGDALKLGIAMKKYSGRTPDFTKLGAKKIDSYRRQFSNEVYDDFLEEEMKKLPDKIREVQEDMRRKGESISYEKAKEKAEEKIRIEAKNRADATGAAIVDSIRLYDDKKDSLTEARTKK